MTSTEKTVELNGTGLVIGGGICGAMAAIALCDIVRGDMDGAAVSGAIAVIAGSLIVGHVSEKIIAAIVSIKRE